MSDNFRKKFINNSENSVTDSLKGVVSANSNIKYHLYNPRVIIRNDIDQLKKDKKVTLITGGGSGHEPFSAGYVGKNGITAAVCGDIFASPPSKHVSDAIEAVYGEEGTLIYVINYTGDRLNFGIAVERFCSNHLNAKINLIFINDDIALESKHYKVGGRGLAGCVLVLHIAGVLADQYKMILEAINTITQNVINNLATIGVSLYACALPGRPPMFELSTNEMEIGLGIHGESGLERCKLMNASKLINVVLKKLCSSKRLSLTKDESICVLLNNLGSVSQLEMNIIQNETLNWLILNGYKVERFISGTLLTSIDGYGFSLTILKIKDSKWINFIDCESTISKYWRCFIPTNNLIKEPLFKTSIRDENLITTKIKFDERIAKQWKDALLNACKVISENEKKLNNLDNVCGDGDCGTSLKTAAKAIESSIHKNEIQFSNPKALLLKLSNIFEEIVGGTSGALYALLFEAASRAFESSYTLTDCKNALNNGLAAIINYGHAVPGCKTMVDPLNAAVNEKSNDWLTIVKVVEKAAQDTSKMEAKMGRASYTSAEHQTQPDAGSIAVALWFRAIYDTFYS